MPNGGGTAMGLMIMPKALTMPKVPVDIPK